MKLTNNNINELNILHKNIESKLKSTVQDAIKAGELLTKIKAELPYGTFLNWIENNCIFSNKTAERYMKVFEHKSKIVTVSNLQEAYNQVKQLESVKKQTENKKAFNRVLNYKKTGVKAKDWKRGTDDKLYKEEIDRDKRIEENKKRIEDKQQETQQGNKVFDNLLNSVINEQEKRTTFKESIRLSFDGKNSPFIDALIDYLEGLEDDNRRIEACYNIIKVTKNITKELQRKVYNET